MLWHYSLTDTESIKILSKLKITLQLQDVFYNHQATLYYNTYTWSDSFPSIVLVPSLVHSKVSKAKVQKRQFEQIDVHCSYV